MPSRRSPKRGPGSSSRKRYTSFDFQEDVKENPSLYGKRSEQKPASSSKNRKRVPSGPDDDVFLSCDEAGASKERSRQRGSDRLCGEREDSKGSKEEECEEEDAEASSSCSSDIGDEKCGYCKDDITSTTNRRNLQCYLCKSVWHRSCVAAFYNRQPEKRFRELDLCRTMDEDEEEEKEREKRIANTTRTPIEAAVFLCAHCRIRHLDPFYSTFAIADGFKILERKDDRVTSDSISFGLDKEKIKKWQEDGFQIHVRSVRMDGTGFTACTWPYKLQLLVDGVEKKPGKNRSVIMPPQMGHHRKEEPFIDITSELVEANKIAKPDKKNAIKLIGHFYSGWEPLEDGEPARYYCVAICAVRPQSLMAVRNRCLASMRDDLTLGTPDWRIQAYFKKLKLEEDDIQVVNENVDAKSLSLKCPISTSTIETPVIGRFCQEEHIQVFDLDSYLETQLQIKNYAQRWKCPVCNRRARTFDLKFCLYANEILRAAKCKAKNELRVSQGLPPLTQEELEKALFHHRVDDDDEDGEYTFVTDMMSSQEESQQEQPTPGKGVKAKNEPEGTPRPSSNTGSSNNPDKSSSTPNKRLSSVQVRDRKARSRGVSDIIRSASKGSYGYVDTNGCSGDGDVIDLDSENEENHVDPFELEEFIEEKVIINEDASYSFNYQAELVDERKQVHGDVQDLEESEGTAKKRRKMAKDVICLSDSD